MDEIYQLFKDQHGYISNLEKVVLYLKEQKTQENEIVEILLKIYSNNKKVKKDLENKNYIISTMNINSPTPLNKKSNTNEIQSSKKQTKTKKNLNIEHYIYMLNKNFNLDELNKILPKDTEELDNIINSIILYHIKERNELLNISNENSSYDELEILINEEVTSINNKIKTLITYRNSLVKDTKEEDIKLVFTNSILNDFENSNIPREAYKDFLSLILSFKNGLPKNSKIFKPNGCAYIVSEVRFNGLRILYDKLNDSTYCLYYAFLKDENDTYYHDTLVYRTNLYYSNKEEILNNKSVLESEESAVKLIKMLKGDQQYGKTN